MESFDRKIESFESKDSYNTRKVSRKGCKLDGRSGFRSVKQIESYKRSFCKADSIELKVGELDVRLRYLQSLVLGVLRGRKTKNNNNFRLCIYMHVFHSVVFANYV